MLLNSKSYLFQFSRFLNKNNNINNNFTNNNNYLNSRSNNNQFNSTNKIFTHNQTNSVTLNTLNKPTINPINICNNLDIIKTNNMGANITLNSSIMTSFSNNTTCTITKWLIMAWVFMTAMDIRLIKLMIMAVLRTIKELRTGMSTKRTPIILVKTNIKGPIKTKRLLKKLPKYKNLQNQVIFPYP